MNLCLGQCYDCASVMSGKVTSVSKKILDDEPRAVYVHYLAHSLNLAHQESARDLPIYRDMLEYTKGIVNLIRSSPKRSAVLSSLQDDPKISSQLVSTVSYTLDNEALINKLNSS